MTRSHSTRRPRSTPRAARRATVAVVMVLALVLLQLTIVAAVIGGIRHQDLTRQRVQSSRSFYAAEAGINMAVRELMNNADEDGDGAIGSISDDANADNNPGPGQGTTLIVSKTVNGSQIIIRSAATAGGTLRTIETVLE